MAMTAKLADGRQIFFERDLEFEQAAYVDCRTCLATLVRCLRISDHWMPDSEIEKPAKFAWWKNHIENGGKVSTPLIILKNGGYLAVGEGRHRMAVLERLRSDFMWFCCHRKEEAGILAQLSKV